MKNQTRQVVIATKSPNEVLGCTVALVILAVLWLAWFIILPVIGLMYLLGVMQ